MTLAIIAGPSADARRPKAIPREAIMAPLKPAVIDDTLEIGGEELDAHKLRSRLTVDVGVNGTGPYRFVVDSGADTTVIGNRLAQALQLPPGRPALLNSMTDTSTVARVVLASLQVGSAEFRDLEVPRLADRDIGAAGMLGLDALVDQRLMLDFERRKITVDDASRPIVKLDNEIVVVARLKRGQLILTQVKAAALPVEAVVDTGSEITIGNRALRDQLMRNNRDKFVTITVSGVTGATMDMQLATIAELQVGPVILRNVPMAFADVPPFEVFGIDRKPALLLGTDLMENFRKVSLDFRARKVRFQLRRCSDGIVIRTSTAGAMRLSLAPGTREACV